MTLGYNQSTHTIISYFSFVRWILFYFYLFGGHKNSILFVLSRANTLGREEGMQRGGREGGMREEERGGERKRGEKGKE